MEFLQDRGALPLQLKDYRWLLDLAFLTELTAKLNDLNTELQGENMTRTTDSFKGKLKLWRTQLMKGVLTHFPSVQSRADGTSDVSAYILCTDNYEY
jgi:hypothetical protein